MAQQELILDYEYYNEEQCSFDDLKDASKKLTTVTEAQFEEIRNEKWFTRVFNMITFSKNNEKRMANQVQNLSQAQGLFIEILVRLSERDTRISELVSESFDKIEKLSKNDVMLAKRVHQLEKKSILGITKETDIEDLSETEREILGGLFYDLMQRFDDVSETQRNYANSVLNYLDVEAQQIHMSESINSINNINKKKKILTCCLEYSFLNQLNFNFPVEIEGLVDEFDFGNKTIREIKSNIQALYNLRGVGGFIDRYGNYDEITESFYTDIPTLGTLADEGRVKLEEFSMNTILHIPKGETKVFKNKDIHINTFINCEGDLEFENCIIHYNESETPNDITLGEGSKLKISHSTVVCHGLDETPFIQGTEKNQIELYESTFQDCAFFIETGHDSKINVDDCQLLNPYVNFINGYSADGILYNSIIQFDKMATFYKEESISGFFNTDFFNTGFFSTQIIQLHRSVLVKDCNILADEGFEYSDDKEYDIFLFFGEAIFENCTFRHVNRCINGFTKINKCIFDNCYEAIKGNFFGNISEGRKITNTLFSSCDEAIGANELLVENNQFIDCKNELICGNGIQIKFCEFYNIKNDTNLNLDDYQDDDSHLNSLKSSKAIASLSSYGLEDTSPTTTIERCSFNGVDTQGGFLIGGSALGNLSSPKIIVKDCNFINCATKRKSGKIIKEYDNYYGLFNKRKQTKTVKIDNCMGLDQVNTEKK